MNDYSDVGFACHGNVLRPEKRAITLVQLLVVIAICGTLLALMLPDVRSTRPPARSQCMANLKQIALALQNYADVHGTLPPAYTTDADGNPLHSWRTLILPHIEHQRFYDSIDLTKPWDDPANAEALATTIELYQCPSAEQPDNHTTYLAVLTPNSCFRATEPRDLTDITRPHSQTLMLIEVGTDHSVPWMSPFDADEQLVLAIGEPHPGGMLAVFADGNVSYLSVELPASQRLAMISIADNHDEPAEEGE